MDHFVDVVIVGAGLSGLSAARTLKNLGKTFVVLEGRDRVGGRTFTTHPELGYKDMGAEYIAQEQSTVWSLVQELGVETIQQYFPANKENILLVPGEGGRVLFQGNIPADQNELDTIAAINLLVGTVTLNAPWNTPNAGELDQQSVADWLSRNPSECPATPSTILAFTMAINAAFSVEPAEMSMLFLLTYAASAGGLMKLFSTDAESYRITFGTQMISERLAATLGDTVVLGAGIDKVLVADSSVRIVVGDDIYHGSRLIVAMSPESSVRLPYEPPLATLPGGEQRVRLANEMPLGATMKIHLVYERTWWRDASPDCPNGYSGYSNSIGVGPVVWTVDNTWRASDQAPEQFPALMAFVVADQARELAKLPPDARRDRVIDHLVAIFDERARTEPLLEGGYIEKYWNDDQWTLGCPTGVMRPGTMTSVGSALRSPVGVIHWAGTESAIEWMGYMDGALQSGASTATEVAALLARSAVDLATE